MIKIKISKKVRSYNEEEVKEMKKLYKEIEERMQILKDKHDTFVIGSYEED